MLADRVRMCSMQGNEFKVIIRDDAYEGDYTSYVAYSINGEDYIPIYKLSNDIVIRGAKTIQFMIVIPSSMRYIEVYEEGVGLVLSGDPGTQYSDLINIDGDKIFLIYGY